MDNKPTGKPAKDLFERFIFENKSLELPVIPNRRKDTLNSPTTKEKKRHLLKFSGQMISVLNYMFYEMYRTRFKREKGFQEVCFVPISTIAKWSRTTPDDVKDAIFYSVRTGILNQLTHNTRAKNMFAPGNLLYEIYPQKLSTGGNLRGLPTQICDESEGAAHPDL